MTGIINIGFDMDGVITSFSKAYSLVLRQLYGDHLPIISNESTEVVAWDWHEWYPLTKEQIAVGWEKLLATNNFWENLEPTNREQIDYLISKLDKHPKINIYFVTSRSPSVGDSLVHQSIRNLKNIGWSDPQVIVSDQKGAIARALDLKFFIDDKAENCAQVSLYYPSTKVYVLDKQYNRILQDRYFHIERITKLSQYADAILKFIGG